MRVVDVPEPGAPGDGEVLVRPGGGRALRLRLPLLPRPPRRRCRDRSLPPRAGARVRRSGRGRRAGLPGRPARGRARCGLAADGVRALLPVPDRPAQRVLEHQPRRHPPRRRAAGAASRAGRRRSSRSAIATRRRRADRARLDRGPSRRSRAHRGGGEGGRLRRRADRSGGRDGRDRPGSVGTARRPRSRAASSAAGRSARTLLTLEDGDDLVAAAREWAGDEGPRGRVRGDRRAGASPGPRSSSSRRRAAWSSSGLSGHDAPLRVGDLAFKEIDVLGVSCCNGDEFAEAVDLVAGGRTRSAGSSRTSSRSSRLPTRSSTRSVTRPRS